MIRTGKQHLLKTFINHVTPTISAVSRQCRQWPVSDVRSMTTHISTANAIKYDFRSDTVTIPTADMRQAIASAEVGDDGYGDDPSINSLEEHVASLCGKEKGLFMVSSTMCNQVAVSVNLHASQMLRQDVIVPEIIIDKRAHLFGRENGGLSLLSRAHTNTIDSGEYGGILTAEDITKNLHMHVDLHQPITSLICLESPNWAGRYMPCSEIKRIRAVIEGGEGKGSEKLPIRMHLDGTRLWNQCIDSGVSMKEVASHFDTVNVCLSKGLGAPIGGVLVGSSRAIDLAKQYRKAFG